MPNTTEEKRLNNVEITIKLKFEGTELTDQEISDRIQYSWNNYSTRPISEFVVTLLRISRAATWELGSIEVKNA